MTLESLLPQIFWFGVFITAVVLARFAVLILCRTLPSWTSPRLGRWRRTGAWHAASKMAAVLGGRAPRASAFLRGRLSRKTFLGWRLTVICLLSVLVSVSFTVITKGVLDDGGVRAFDDAILASLSALRIEPLLTLFSWLTNLGGNAAFTAAVLTAAGLLWVGREGHLLLGLWVSVLGSQGTLWIAKFAFGRVRPEFLTDAIASSPSFPSGHTTGAVAIYGFIAYAIARLAASPVARVEVGFWAAVGILLIGFSRIYLHVHYPTDVVGGILLGGFWLVLGCAVTEWRCFTTARTPKTDGITTGAPATTAGDRICLSAERRDV